MLDSPNPQFINYRFSFLVVKVHLIPFSKVIVYNVKLSFGFKHKNLKRRLLWQMFVQSLHTSVPFSVTLFLWLFLSPNFHFLGLFILFYFKQKVRISFSLKMYKIWEEIKVFMILFRMWAESLMFLMFFCILTYYSTYYDDYNSLGTWLYEAEENRTSLILL